MQAQSRSATGYGGLRRELGDLQREALVEHHPHFFGLWQKGPQEAASPLRIWLEREWVALGDHANHAYVDAAIQELLAAAPDVTQLVNALFEIDGIDEVFVGDDELATFLEGW